MSGLRDDITRALHDIQDIKNKQELTITKLIEPLSGLVTESSSKDASHEVSTELLENPTPAALEADLAHYKELFSKLRFSYLEQVTKEKFIRAIVGDPPLVVEQQDNIELEESLADKKVSLKSLKFEVTELVAELEKRGRELYRKHRDIEQQTLQLQELLPMINSLEANLQSLRDLQNAGSNPHLLLPLDKTLECIEEREKKIAELDQQINQLNEVMIPGKTRQLERLGSEVKSLEAKSLSSAASARDAKRRREEALGGIGDDLEERGRWWTAVENGLKNMLEIDTCVVSTQSTG
ncbi:Kinetochore protein Sos7 [Golovinomyces cichoracearum]|uniref:Kinetochore protein Sos7 n=1 Tax=Golovinomyces cichoracearum TaxID=62708 RepID=A0A420J1G2_9PEZI|nr:Kinetochore protein Sos7 [Golovinomyces cichoracearum]